MQYNDKTINEIVLITEELKNLDNYFDEKINFYNSLRMIPITTYSLIFLEKGINNDLGDAQKVYYGMMDKINPYRELTQVQKWYTILDKKWNALVQLREELVEN